MALVFVDSRVRGLRRIELLILYQTISNVDFLGTAPPSYPALLGHGFFLSRPFRPDGPAAVHRAPLEAVGEGLTVEPLGRVSELTRFLISSHLARCHG